MKESVLIKMQYDLKLVQQALVVALTRLDRYERVSMKTHNNLQFSELERIGKERGYRVTEEGVFLGVNIMY